LAFRGTGDEHLNSRSPHLSSAFQRAAGRRDRAFVLNFAATLPSIAAEGAYVLPSEAMSGSPQQSPRQHEHRRVFANCVLTMALYQGLSDSSKFFIYNTIGA
jgi:hypothetical protein